MRFFSTGISETQQRLQAIEKLNSGFLDRLRVLDARVHELEGSMLRYHKHFDLILVSFFMVGWAAFCLAIIWYKAGFHITRFPAHPTSTQVDEENDDSENQRRVSFATLHSFFQEISGRYKEDNHGRIIDNPSADEFQHEWKNSHEEVPEKNEQGENEQVDGMPIAFNSPRWDENRKDA